MQQATQISVRSLVEYVFRSGSIDSRFRSSSTLQQGTDIHKMIQQTYGPNDEKEVYLKTQLELDDVLYTVDGRCDGLRLIDGEVTIEEIKSTATPLSSIDINTKPVHWAQAKCYAYMYMCDHDIEKLQIQLTYVHVDTKEQKSFTRQATRTDLEVFIKDLLESYSSYAKAVLSHQQKLLQSCQKLEFPFQHYRRGQRQLAGAVYTAIAEGKTLFVKAPTGIGKTISTMFPAIKAIGEIKATRIFYTTAKTTTRHAAEDALRHMESKGLHIHTVTLTAKDKICFQDKTVCHKEACPFADGYYDRINEAVLDILQHETLMTRNVIERYARKHEVCPFEFSLDLAYSSDIVICDYNYIFDPRVSLKRLLQEQKNKSVLLVDEAHNLVDRGREMFSASLLKSPFLQLKREMTGSLKIAAKAINDELLTLKKQRKSTLEEIPEVLLEKLNAFVAAAEIELLAVDDELLLETYFTVQNFLRIATLYDERFILFVDYYKSEVHVRLFCLDPSHVLPQMSKGYRTAVFFSATLVPLSYYQDMLAGDTLDKYTLDLPSPFSKEQLDIQICPISTRLNDRERTKDAVVSIIVETISRRPGNFLIFFPSYQYLQMVYEECVASDLQQVQWLVQESSMSDLKRDEFLNSFQANAANSIVGFAVLGGVFSEGVDLVGNRLTGVIVIGVGLPQLSVERNHIRDYFNKQGKNGYYYSYVFPGMNKVLQASGRLIRTETDKGTIILIDDRFLQPIYQKLLPRMHGDGSQSAKGEA
ncbi:ATP-dependent DNA helicase [Bacillus salinus]|uniref:ATP-dependent DNA helicase n=1 Tax=Bacillus sp. HMF5848 TaxID=2495421 RepID=UPI0021AD6FA9|nr:ATP-dependent DNA helicase [Bacillus sp. HMF5848]